MFSKIPPAISIPVFYIIVTAIFFIQFFLGSLFGIFILTIALYEFSPTLLGSDPYTFGELVNWFSLQSETAKTSLMGAIVTVVGFLIAYATAMHNWKAQMLSQLRLQAAGEIDAFFAQASQLTTNCEIYAEALVSAIDEIQKGCQQSRAEFLAHYNRDQGQLFLQRRQQLVALGIEVHRLHGRYTNLLIMTPGLKTNMELAVNALTNITEQLWFNVPYHIDGDANPIQTFVNQVCIADCIKFTSAAKENFGQLNFTSGGVRGILQSSVVGFSLWSVLFLYKERKGFKEAINEHYNSRRRNG